MSYPRRLTTTVTTSTGGAATAYLPAGDGDPPISGKVSSIIYTTVDFSTTADFTITAEATGQGLWTESNVTASKTVAPRQPTHDNTGTASLYAGGGEPVEDGIVLADDRIKIVIAQGGNAKSGTFTAIIE